MNPFDLRNFEFRPQRDLDLRDRLKPDAVFHWRWLFKCNVKILVVTDSFSGGYSASAGFHLGQMIDVVNADPWSHINFDFTKAHRDGSGEADVIDNFRFDQHNLSKYSQIWLFGISREGDGTPLSDAELQALSRFMDDGGGLFATGDHEDLGNSMCARVPRARSMRRWWYPNAGPNGEPVAPAAVGVGQHDTLVNGGTQTDPDPQKIRPRMYQRTLIAGVFLKKVAQYPHPVLCGPNGVLNYLPDHMHEGLCEVPSDLSQSFSFNGETFEEYPTKNGQQEHPEVIAWAQNNVSSSEFGVLAAYDGHEVDVGRVVVDATWHHWFNINTAPYANASNPGHPSYTPATIEKWEEIQAYFRNVAVWLAKPTMQSCIRNGGWIRVLGDYDIKITHQSLKRIRDPQLYFWQLGTFAKDALGRSAPQCQVLRWIFDIIYPRELQLARPFRSKRPEPELKLDGGFDFEEMELVLLGAAIHEGMDKFRDVENPEKLIEDDGVEVEKILREGSVKGLELFAERLKRNADGFESFMKVMRG